MRQDGSRDRMLAALLGGGRERKRFLFRARLQRLHAIHARLPKRERASLVEPHVTNAPRTLERTGVLHQNAAKTRFTCASHDRHRCGESKRARAADDEHRGGGEHTGGPLARHTPADHGGKRDQQHHRHEHAGHAISHRLNGRAARLRALHLQRDARERGAATIDGASNHQIAGQVQRACRHRIAGLARHRQRLARDHAFIQIPGARNQRPIDRNAAAGAHAHAVARAHLGGRDAGHRTIGRESLNLLGLQLQQFAHGRARARRRARLHPVTDGDDGEQCGGLAEPCGLVHQ